jgi:hypothetical protein
MARLDKQSLQWSLWNRKRFVGEPMDEVGSIRRGERTIAKKDDGAGDDLR